MTRALALVFLLATPAAASPLLATWRGGGGDTHDAVFTPDGSKVLTAYEFPFLKMWDTASGAELAVWNGHAGQVFAVALTPDGKRALSGSEDETLKLWDTASGRVLATLRGHRDEINSLAVAPDGRTAASVSYDGTIIFWDLEKQTRLAVLAEDSGALSCAFSPDGKRLITGHWDKTLRLWDVAARRPAARWRGHRSQVLAAVFSPDGSQVLSGSRDNTAILWDAASGRPLSVWRGHDSHVNTVAFSPDGRTALTGSSDYTIRKWEVETGRELAVWQGHQGAVFQVAFSPNGALAVSTGEDDTVRVWDADGSARGSVKDPPRPRPDSPGKAGAAELGRVLFYDTRLTGDNSHNCAWCHDPRRAFTNGNALSLGYPDTLYFRNTPTLINAAELRSFYWDGRARGDGLAAVLREHIETHFMNADGRLIAEKIRQAPAYEQAFREVYGAAPDYANITAALAAFIRTLKSAAAAPPPSPAARRGQELFSGQGGCARCHSGPLFTDEKFHDRRVPKNPELLSEPLRRASLRRFFKELGVPDFARLREDVGRYAVTKDPGDRGRFRTPSLREAARTAPYMHNGMYKTLEEAVAHENSRLSAAEVGDIAAFLRSLSSPAGEFPPPPIPEYEVRAEPPPRRRPLAPPAAGTFPPLAPLTPVPIPGDNPPTPEKIELGARLFHDPRISGSGDIRCASCHEPALGWGDNGDLAQGFSGTLHWRNAPSLLNAARYRRLGWNATAAGLEEQVREMLASNLTMNGAPAMIEETLTLSPRYTRLFKQAFNVERPHFRGVILALSSYLRTAPATREAPLDEFLKGGAAALSAAAVRGRGLFAGQAGCLRCHNGPLATDQALRASGVPENPAFDRIPLRQVARRYQRALRGLSDEDRETFRTPSLRGLTHTAPYMHNGVFKTLREVVEYYDREARLGLSPRDKQDLIAFLESLSGAEIPVEHPGGIGPYHTFLEDR
ncbi:MAG: cytochrome c peroxidase [Elusimicrobiota bacterium]